MKSAFLAIVLLLVAGSARNAQGASRNCTLNVHIHGLRNRKGMAAAVVFNSPKGWPEQEADAYATDEARIDGAEATVSFHLPPGKYSVAVLHDENGNHKLDRNFLGIPTEGFGFANNPHVFFSAPSFKSAQITVGCPVTNIDVKIIHK